MKNKLFQLQLKVLWCKDYLGFAVENVSLDQSYALTPYYFWPKTEAWEQLRLKLNFKLWVCQEEKIKLLNNTGNIMKYWLLHQDTKTEKALQETFPNVNIIVLDN